MYPSFVKKLSKQAHRSGWARDMWTHKAADQFLRKKSATINHTREAAFQATKEEANHRTMSVDVLRAHGLWL